MQMPMKILTVFLAITCSQCQWLVDNPASFGVALDQAVAAAEIELKHERDKLHIGVNGTVMDNNVDQQSLFYTALDSNYTTLAEITLAALSKLIDADLISLNEIKSNGALLDVWKKRFRNLCPPSVKPEECNPMSPYRSANGQCNNLDHPMWGAALTPQLREMPPVYGDGISKPRLLKTNGKALQGSRVISNKIFDCPEKSKRNPKLTVMVMQWGQFIDHDFISTPVMKDLDGGKLTCCDKENRDRRECSPIYLPAKDPHFKEQGCMNLIRSAPSLDIACHPGPREQVNKMTSFLDGSAMYGSDITQTRHLRTLTGGFMWTSQGNLLPYDAPSVCTLTDRKDHCQKAGDSRVNVLPSLGLSHLTFVREHNRIASELGRLNRHWDDETIFQETKRIVVAIEQHIHYKEYLPAILDEDTMVKYNLTLSSTYKNVYNSTINPGVTNVFGAAAFRFGHSQIPDYQATQAADFRFTLSTPIEDTYHDPHLLVMNYGENMAGMARWLSYDFAPKADKFFENGTRNLLFPDKKGHTLDLPAVNTQRGRDHGLPPYSQWRKHCNLEPASMTAYGTFILPGHDREAVKTLMDTYNHVNDIDLFVGAMTESLLPDSSVGPTFACLLARQFRSLKEGDRFWYESPDEVIRFTPEQLREIKTIRLSKLLCDNYDLDQLQPDVFHVPGQDNAIRNCALLPSLNLTHWRSCSDMMETFGRPVFDLTRCEDTSGTTRYSDINKPYVSASSCMHFTYRLFILVIVILTYFHC